MFERSEFRYRCHVVQEAAYHKAGEGEPDEATTRAQEGTLDPGQVVLTRGPLTSSLASKLVVGYVDGIGVILVAARNLAQHDAPAG